MALPVPIGISADSTRTPTVPKHDDTAQERRDEPAERLLVAMLELTGEIGYERVAVSGVLKKAGAGRASFYRRWDDKEACFLEAHRIFASRLVGEMLHASEPGASWRDSVAAGLGRLLRFVSEMPELAKALIVDIHAVPAAVEVHYRLRDQLAEAIDKGRAERTEPDDALPPRTAKIICGGVEQVLSSELVGESGRGVWRLMPQLMYLIVLPYLGREQARAELASAPLAPPGQAGAHGRAS